MNKKTVGGLALLAGMIIVIVLLLWRFYSGGPPPPGTAAAPAPPAPTAVAPTPTPPPAVPPAPVAQEPPAAPPGEPPGPAKGLSPGGEVNPPAPQVAPLPPLKPEPQYGFLGGTFRRYRDADRMANRLRKRGKSAFMRREGGRFQVWVGPFASPGEAEAAAKSLRRRHKKVPKIERIDNPIPK